MVAISRQAIWAFVLLSVGLVFLFALSGSGIAHSIDQLGGDSIGGDEQPWYVQNQTSLFDASKNDPEKPFGDSTDTTRNVSDLNGKTPAEAAALSKDYDFVYRTTNPTVELATGSSDSDSTSVALSDLYYTELERFLDNVDYLRETSLRLDTSPPLQSGRFIKNLHVSFLAVPDSATLIEDNDPSEPYIIPPHGESTALIDYQVVNHNWCINAAPSANETIDSEYSPILEPPEDDPNRYPDSRIRTCVSETPIKITRNHTVEVGNELFVDQYDNIDSPHESTVPYGNDTFKGELEPTTLTNQVKIAGVVERNVTVEIFNTTSLEWEVDKEFAEYENISQTSFDSRVARFLATDALGIEQTIYQEKNGNQRIRIEFKGKRGLSSNYPHAVLWTYANFANDKDITNIWRAFSIKGDPISGSLVTSEGSTVGVGEMALPEVYIAPTEPALENNLFAGRLYIEDTITDVNENWTIPHGNVSLSLPESTETHDTLILDVNNSPLQNIYDISGRSLQIITTKKTVQPTEFEYDITENAVTFRLMSGGEPVSGEAISVSGDPPTVKTTDSAGEITVERTGKPITAEYDGYSPFTAESGTVYNEAKLTINPATSGGFFERVDQIAGVIKWATYIVLFLLVFYLLIRYVR